MKKIMCQTLVTLFAIGLCHFPALLTVHTLDADAGDLIEEIKIDNHIV